MKEFTYTIKDKLGIHARPAGLLVKCAKSCESKITLKFKDKSADAEKLFSIMGMSVKQGDTLNVSIEGVSEEQDYNTILNFFETNL